MYPDLDMDFTGPAEAMGGWAEVWRVRDARLSFVCYRQRQGAEFLKKALRGYVTKAAVRSCSLRLAHAIIRVHPAGNKRPEPETLQ